MPIPSASRNNAFITGISLFSPTYLLYILKSTKVISYYGIDNPRVFAGFVIYGLLTLLVFLIDIRSLAPKALKTSIPWVYFPTNR